MLIQMDLPTVSYPPRFFPSNYFEFYKTLATSFEDNGADYPTLRIHGDVLIILDQLKIKPASSRSKLRETLFEDI